MEKTIRESQTLEPAPEHATVTEYPVECPACMSGIDPTVGIGLFQEALLESL